MMRAIALFVVAFLLWVAPVRMLAQETTRPTVSNGVWLSAQVRGNVPWALGRALGKYNRNIRLSGELGHRSADNFFAGRQIYLETGLRYKLNKTFDIGGEYRYADRGPSRTNRHRLQLSASADRSFGRLDLSYRLVHQWTYRKHDTTTRFIRNRLGFEFNIPNWKLDPEFSVEFFTRTDDPRGWNYDGSRYRFGTKYKINDKHSLDATLIYDRDEFVAWPTRRIILSLGYVMDLRWL